MTKKQLVQFFVLGIIYSALVSSLGSILAHILGFASLIYVFWTVLTVEKKGYAK